MEMFYIVGGIIVVLLLWGIGTRNGIKMLEVKVEEGFSGIDVAFEKRYDLLNNMFKVAKGYAKHERETLGQVVAYRKGMSIEELSDANKQISEGFATVYALAENYPALKADAVFVNLQAAVGDAEEHLQAARRVYNSNVTAYNQKIIAFPNSIVAGLCKATKKTFFRADDEKRRNVSLDF